VERGIQILTDLARKGHPYAQMNLAAIVMRTKTDGGKTAVQLYELAGRGGLDMAWTELGRMYRAGLGVEQDHTKAVEYFRKGAQSGNTQCNFMLGVYASTPQADGAADQAAAFKYFQKAAIKGIPTFPFSMPFLFPLFSPNLSFHQACQRLSTMSVYATLRVTGWSKTLSMPPSSTKWQQHKGSPLLSPIWPACIMKVEG
jgi:hypothetical protein